MTAVRDPLEGVHLPVALEPVHLGTCDSAIAEAVRRARAGAPEGTLVWADDQGAPRGRRGAPWSSPPGGLHAAVILRPDLSAARWGEFVPLGVVALGAAIATLVAPLTDLAYRWPNAVLLGGGRAAGVWLAANADWLVLAVSANVVRTADPANFRHACVAIEGGNPDATVAALLERYAYQLVNWLARWDDEGFGPVLGAFRNRVGPRRDPVTACMADGSSITGRQTGIADDGALLLEGRGGEHRVTLNGYLGLPE